jgi:hypothetical protein
MGVPACYRSSQLFVVCAFFGGVIPASGTAHAQEREAASPASSGGDTGSRTDAAIAPAHPRVHRKQSEGESTWYGWQTLLVDGGSLAVFAAALSVQSSQLGWFSGGTYALGPAVVHAAHGRGGAAAASIALRLGLPLVASIIGMGIGGNCEAGQGGCIGPLSSSTTGALLGAGVGMVIAMGIDAAVLSYESTRDPDADDAGGLPDPTRRAATVSLAPSVSPVRGGAVGGVSVVF